MLLTTFKLIISFPRVIRLFKKPVHYFSRPNGLEFDYYHFLQNTVAGIKQNSSIFIF